MLINRNSLRSEPVIEDTGFGWGKPEETFDRIAIISFSGSLIFKKVAKIDQITKAKTAMASVQTKKNQFVEEFAKRFKPLDLIIAKSLDFIHCSKTVREFFSYCNCLH